MTTDDNPFRTLERQFERMQRQFEDALEQWNGAQFGMSGTDTGTASGMGIDLADRGETFVLTADVPGFEKDEIDIRLSGDTLQITAEREQATTEEGDDEAFYIKSERKRQSLSRSVRVPDPVDENAIEATYRNGVVTVTLPKREPTEPTGRRIDIE
ncbi:Hsp20/alpha crystallin family protein [Natrarchaeobius chitinivorans]|uniref:Hsp20/alpha crystallin family protein n=1 Tax=Natrarchaeobius chitinivorans TaxID=1679083 RepID=A0A3N6M4P5_NATCH|nr:Hsp20/alpha crystallin family protein [Natrarchaeobius chitinivorans]RQG95474.1 Hsp20/alpha crystallin family protein [Natrarchaeobius chitinivorans]